MMYAAPASAALLLATEAGVSSHVVRSALGQSSPAVTHAHYIQPGTQKRRSTKP